VPKAASAEIDDAGRDVDILAGDRQVPSEASKSAAPATSPASTTRSSAAMLVKRAAQRVVPALPALSREPRRGPGHRGLHCGAQARVACSSRRSVGMTNARPSAAAISAWMLLRLATDRAASTTLAPSPARPRATTRAESLAGAGHHRDPAHKIATVSSGSVAYTALAFGNKLPFDS